MAYRAEYHLDPLKIMLMKESWTCKGCQSQKFTYGIEWCAKDKSKAAAPPKHMKRCNKYQEEVKMLSEYAFMCGEVVRLKSNGQSMTVEYVIGDNTCPEPIVWCKWFDGNELKRDRFYVDELMKKGVANEGSD